MKEDGSEDEDDNKWLWYELTTFFVISLYRNEIYSTIKNTRGGSPQMFQEVILKTETIVPVQGNGLRYPLFY